MNKAGDVLAGAALDLYEAARGIACLVDDGGRMVSCEFCGGVPNWRGDMKVHADDCPLVVVQVACLEWWKSKEAVCDCSVCEGVR